MHNRQPTMRSRELGEGLRRAMEAAGLTGVEAARRLDWSPSRVSRMLSGTRGTTEWTSRCSRRSAACAGGNASGWKSMTPAEAIGSRPWASRRRSRSAPWTRSTVPSVFSGPSASRPSPTAGSTWAKPPSAPGSVQVQDRVHDLAARGFSARPQLADGTTAVRSAATARLSDRWGSASLASIWACAEPRPHLRYRRHVITLLAPAPQVTKARRAVSNTFLDPTHRRVRPGRGSGTLPSALRVSSGVPT